MDRKTVMLMVTTDSPETLTRACEAFARAASGLAMEDVPAMLLIQDPPEELDGGPFGGKSE